MELIRYLLLESSLCNIFEVLPITVLTMGLTAWRLRSKKMPRWRLISITLFAGYAAAVINIICAPAYFWHTVWHSLWYENSFDDVTTLISRSLFSGSFQLAPTGLINVFFSSGWSWFMLLANIALFIPFGILYPLLSKNATFNKTIGTAFAASLILELIQPIAGRSFDTSDLVTYLLGCIIGYLVYKAFTLLYIK